MKKKLHLFSLFVWYRLNGTKKEEKEEEEAVEVEKEYASQQRRWRKRKAFKFYQIRIFIKRLLLIYNHQASKPFISHS